MARFGGSVSHPLRIMVGMKDRVAELAEELGGVVNDLVPHALSGSDAVELVGLFARIGKLAAAGQMLAARRVEDLGAHRRQGFRSAAHLMAQESGTSLGSAIEAMETARKAERLPATQSALRQGRLSPKQ